MTCDPRWSAGLALCLLSSSCSLLFKAGEEQGDTAEFTDARAPLDAAPGDGSATDAISADAAGSPCGTSIPVANCTGQLVSFAELSEGTVLQEHQGIDFSGAWRVVSTADETCGITFNVPETNRNMVFGTTEAPTTRRLLRLGVKNLTAEFYTVTISTGQAGKSRAQGLSAGQYYGWDLQAEEYFAQRLTFSISTGEVSDEFVINYLCHEAP